MSCFLWFRGGPRALGAQFQRDHYIILPKLIEPDLLATILKRIESAPSVQKEDDGLIAESIIDDPHTYNLFLFLLSTPEFQRLVQRITGCHRIADFQGCIYRLNPTTGDRIVWHTDVCDHRVMTFFLNLTAQEYRGGTLQIRNRGSDEILYEVRNTRHATLFSCVLRTSYFIASCSSKGMSPGPPWQSGFAVKRKM